MRSEQHQLGWVLDSAVAFTIIFLCPHVAAEQSLMRQQNVETRLTAAADQHVASSSPMPNDVDYNVLSTAEASTLMRLTVSSNGLVGEEQGNLGSKQLSLMRGDLSSRTNRFSSERNDEGAQQGQPGIW